MDTSFSGISCRDTIVTSRHHNLLADNDLSPLEKEKKKKQFRWKYIMIDRETINSKPWVNGEGIIVLTIGLDFVQMPSRFNIMRPSFGYVYTSKIVPGGGLASFCMSGFHVLIYKGSIWDNSFYV